jgi:hypothetical protein
MHKGAGIRVKLTLTTVLWTPYPPFPGEDPLTDWRGIELYKPDKALQKKIVKMLRAVPKKWYLGTDRNKGRNHKIFELPGVSGMWY